MRRFQFSLRALLGLVLFVAVGCAALVHANELVASAVYSVTLLVLFVAIVRGLFGADSGRVFWLGFAIFGWGYVWLAYGEIQILGLGLPATRALATTKLLDFVYLAIWRSGPDPFVADPEHFMTIGHSLFALVFGFVGGLLSWYFHRTREKEP